MTYHIKILLKQNFAPYMSYCLWGLLSVYVVFSLCGFCIVLLSSSVHSPFGSPFGSRSVLDRFSFCSRLVLDRFSIVLRSILVHPPFILRSFSVRESKIDRRTNGESSEAKRRCIETLMGNQGKGNPNKNFIFNYLDSNYYGKFFRILNTPPNGVRLAREVLILLK